MEGSEAPMPLLSTAVYESGGSGESTLAQLGS